MIKLFVKDGIFSPVVICDECKERIFTADAGMALSPLNPDAGVLTIEQQIELENIVGAEESIILYLHKEKCFRIAEGRFDAERRPYGSYSLNDHFFYLLQNLKLNPAGLDDPNE